MSWRGSQAQLWRGPGSPPSVAVPTFTLLRPRHSSPSHGENGIGPSSFPAPRALLYGQKKTFTTPRQVKAKAKAAANRRSPRSTKTSSSGNGNGNGYATYSTQSNCNNTLSHSSKTPYTNSSYQSWPSFIQANLAPVTSSGGIFSRRSKHPVNGHSPSDAVYPNRSRYLLIHKF